MSIVNSVETVREWLEKNVCPEVELKFPDDIATDGSYSYKTIHPAVFSMHLPQKDRLPPEIPTSIPSICVQIVSGEDHLRQSGRRIKFRLSFSTWDPGIHAEDVFIPKGDGSYVRRKKEKKDVFRRTGDGWQSVWNFVDTAIRIIESEEYIGDLRVDRESPITFGPFAEQGSIPDFYPYWFAWIEFWAETTLNRIPEQYKQFL